MTAIRIERLTRTFGAVRAVDDISLAIAHGELFTLLGPSGCGKTTLLRMIAGFVDVESGSISFGDRRIDNLPAHRRDTGMVFQNYAIFPNHTVAENVAYGLKARKIPAADIKSRVDKALERVRLAGYGPRSPHQLSGGQLQRVAIARALVIEPAVLLFDEPLSNLDAQLRTEMRIEIRQLQQALGLTAIYVTHDQEEALAISDRIAVLRHGKVEQVDTPERIYRMPQTAFVAEFLGSTNMVPGVAKAFDGRNTQVAAAGTEFSVRGEVGKPGAKVLLSLRPEALRLADSSDGPRVQARLALREFLGPVQRLHATLPDGTQLRVAALGGATFDAAPGASLVLAYDPAQIIAFPAP
ncbi:MULTISPECIES: ABC transporter ATP-binding protein [unclassified Bradyrhizobium]|uniref:ABC transporter ATP-binding protein n=1 Tax=unclassified Bradyrhizobium TaxID=2631580 RepID=UPI0020B1B384|nr:MULTISPECIES: ABC transporter ATP-binding protein [unclassified Bradyrhizobium]MCP3442374.1 ABC transporter ATP-binding protein [Bradyrhizobium sp. CCGUVB14]WFU79082.1 ABC transporter ATP-binding protein [Bradyrhizobium sp. CIAT3101]